MLACTEKCTTTLTFNTLSKVANIYLVGGNGLMNGILGFFSLFGLTDSLIEDAALRVFTNIVEGILSVNLIIITSAAYDGNIKDVIDVFTKREGTITSKLVGLLSGFLKGITGFVAAYSLQQKLLALETDKDEIHGWFIIVGIFAAIPYWLMETVKICTKLDLLVNDWDQTTADYWAMSRTKKAATLCHFFSAQGPAWFSLTALALTLRLPFWPTLLVSFVLSNGMAIGPTNQYAIKWTGAERRDQERLRTSEQADAPLAPAAEPSKRAKNVTIAMTATATTQKFSLSVLSLLIMSELFNNLQHFKDNLNLPGLHNLAQSEFKNPVVWGITLVYAVTLSIGYGYVQYPRLEKKALDYFPAFFDRSKITPCCSSEAEQQEELCPA